MKSYRKILHQDIAANVSTWCSCARSFHTMLLHVEYVFIKWMCDDFVFKHVQICKSLMKEGVFPPFPHDCSSSVNM